MSNRGFVQILDPAPTIVGTGLVALDAVVDSDQPDAPRFWGGGTCANVSTILSSFGWRAFPVARLNGDFAGRSIEQDLRRWGVQFAFARTTPVCRTSIIVHRIVRRLDGAPTHRFNRTCPKCGAWYPTYQPVGKATARRIIPALPPMQVLFVDRVSRGAVILAEAARESGAVVVFEPSGVGDARLFQELAGLAHVIKYSRDQRHKFPELSSLPMCLLEVETLGPEGLRYRSTLPSSSTHEWLHLSGFSVTPLRDAAGSGDWCTAGMLHGISQSGLAGLQTIDAEGLVSALQLGQALAAWNCAFEGARGGMYGAEFDRLPEDVAKIISGDALELDSAANQLGGTKGSFEDICAQCSGAVLFGS